MATTTKRRKKYSKKKLIARLEVLRSKEKLSKEEERELQDILNRLGRKQKDKLNIAAHNDGKAIHVIINNNISTTDSSDDVVVEELVPEESTEDLDSSNDPLLNEFARESIVEFGGFATPDHFSSVAGTYRKAKLDNRKNKEKK